MSCTQLVSAIGAANDAFGGAYCIKTGTEFDAGSACGASCDPKASPCP